MIEVEAQTIVADALDDLGEEAEQTIIPYVLVLERRQYERTRDPSLERRAAQPYGVGEGAGPGPWQ